MVTRQDIPWRLRGLLMSLRGVHTDHLFVQGWPGISRGGQRTQLILGRGVRIYRGVAFYLDGPGAVIEVGDHTFLNRRTEIACRSRVTIGANCAIAWDVVISDTDYHSIDDDTPTDQPVAIGDHVWVGARSQILKGVTIGDGAVIAAGSVVNKDVAARSLVAGVPARVLRENVAWK